MEYKSLRRRRNERNKKIQRAVERMLERPAVSIADTFKDTYGAKVWAALNSRTTTYNVLSKVEWKETAGWSARIKRDNNE